MRIFPNLRLNASMTPRQREIFEQLATGIDLEKWNRPAKRIQDAAPTSTERQSSKKQKTKKGNAPSGAQGHTALHADPVHAGVAGFALTGGLFSGSETEKALPDANERSQRSTALEKAAEIRKENGIKVSSPQSTPFPVQSFMELPEMAQELTGLLEYTQQAGFDRLTAIQMQAIPALLQGRDVVGIAPTGSGKTLAFLIPLMAHLSKEADPKVEQIKGLVISPTCELSSQTYHTFKNLQHFFSGHSTPISAFLLDKTSKKKLQNRHPCVLFSTPFALVKQIQKTAVDVTHVQFLVLDEVDRLFSMEKRGSSSEDVSDLRHYIAQVDAIVSACPSQHIVKALFSATFPPHVSDLAANILVDPVHITVGKKNSAVPSVEQHMMYTGSERGKLLAIRQIFAGGIKPPVMIFVDTKERARSLLSALRMEGINAAGMHSEMDGQQRNRILHKFQTGQIWVLIATDLVSRGIDFVGVNVVINYDFPKSTMDYIHRIGRTGRAGRKGESYTFFTDADRGYIRPIANTIRDAGGDVPEWMTTMKKDNWKNKRAYGAVGVDKDPLCWKPKRKSAK